MSLARCFVQFHYDSGVEVEVKDLRRYVFSKQRRLLKTCQAKQQAKEDYVTPVIR